MGRDVTLQQHSRKFVRALAVTGPSTINERGELFD
jgi:hypothetical protein